MIHRVEHETKINCPADEFYGKFKNNIYDLPNLLPGSYKSFEVLEGDGKSNGSIILLTYTLGDDPNKVLSAKERLEDFDDENRTITFIVLEGDLMEEYESFAIKFSVTPTSDGGSLMKWVTEFEKKHDLIPHPHSTVDVLASVSGHFDALHSKEAASAQ